MTEKIGEAVLELTTDDRALDEGVKRAEGKAKALQDRFAASGASIRRLGQNLTLGVTTPLLAIGAVAVRGALEQERAVARVEATLAATNNAVGLTSQRLQQLATDMQAMTTFGDEEIMEDVTASLLKFDAIAGDTFERAQRAVLDFAAQTGTGLATAAQQIGRALQDPAAGMDTLRRAGIVFSAEQRELIKGLAEAGDAAGAQAAMLQALEARFGGVAAAMAQTTEGQMKQLTNQWGDLQEEFGAVIIEILPPLIAGLKAVVSWLQQLDPQTKTWIVGLAGLAAAAGPVLTVLGMLVAGIGALLSPIALVVAAVAGVVTALVVFNDEITAAGDAIVEVFLGMGERVVTIVADMVAGIREWLVDQLAGVIDGVKEQIDKAVGFFQDMYEWVVGNSIVPDMIDEIGAEFARLDVEMAGRARTAADAAVGIFEDMSEVTSTILANVEDALGNFIETGKLDVGSFVQSTLRDLAKLGLRGLLGGFGGLFSGFFADGGIIPAGSFGIVGERGPEPVIATSRGAIVTPSSAAGGGSAGGGTVNVTIAPTFRGPIDASMRAWFQSQMQRMREDVLAEVPATVVAARGRNPGSFES